MVIKPQSYRARQIYIKVFIVDKWRSTYVSSWKCTCRSFLEERAVVWGQRPKILPGKQTCHKKSLEFIGKHVLTVIWFLI